MNTHIDMEYPMYSRDRSIFKSTLANTPTKYTTLPNRTTPLGQTSPRAPSTRVTAVRRAILVRYGPRNVTEVKTTPPKPRTPLPPAPPFLCPRRDKELATLIHRILIQTSMVVVVPGPRMRFEGKFYRGEG